MKKIIPYLSYLVLILTMFGFIGLASAQENQTKKDYSYSVNLDFGYDLLSEYKKIELKDKTSDTVLKDRDASDIFSSSNDQTTYKDLKLTLNILTKKFRVGFGAGAILSYAYDNNPFEKQYDNENKMSFNQEFQLGFYLQLLQLGYRINLNFIELVPYFSINLSYLQTQDKILIHSSQSDKSNVIDIHKISAPLYIGLNVIFAHAGPVSFYGGFEIGRNIDIASISKLKPDNSNVLDNLPPSTEANILNNSDPLIEGYTGKLILGTAFNL